LNGNPKALQGINEQPQVSNPPSFPETKHAWAHPLAASCNHLLLQGLAPASDTGKGNKKLKTYSSTHISLIDSVKVFQGKLQ
jgi:hypothetical protein